MSSVDISALGNLTPSQPLDLSNYPTSKLPDRPAKAPFSLLPTGEYVLRAPDAFSGEAFSKTQKGTLAVAFDAPVVAATTPGVTIPDNTVVRFIRASATTFPREVGGTVQLASFMADLVKSAGITGTFPAVDDNGSAQAQADMVASIAGRTFKAKLDWEARDRKFGSGINVKGMYKFPKREDGTFQPYFELDGKDGRIEVKNERGYPERVWANLTVTSFITE